MGFHWRIFKISSVSMPKYKGLCFKMCLKIEGVESVNSVTRVSNFIWTQPDRFSTLQIKSLIIKIFSTEFRRQNTVIYTIFIIQYAHSFCIYTWRLMAIVPASDIIYILWPGLFLSLFWRRRSDRSDQKWYFGFRLGKASGVMSMDSRISDIFHVATEILRTFELSELKCNLNSSACRPSKIIWNDTKIEPISLEPKR